MWITDVVHTASTASHWALPCWPFSGQALTSLCIFQQSSCFTGMSLSMSYVLHGKINFLVGKGCGSVSSVYGVAGPLLPSPCLLLFLMAGTEAPWVACPIQIAGAVSHPPLAPGPCSLAFDDSSLASSQCNNRSLLITLLDFWTSETLRSFIF